MPTIGLLWYNRAKHTHEKTLRTAVKRHIARLGTRPNVVYVSPEYVGPDVVLKMEVRQDEAMQPYYYYLIVDPDLPELEIKREFLPDEPVERPIQATLFGGDQ
jgi:hypothetical protein